MPQVFFQPESVFRVKANALAAQETVRIRRLIPATDIQHIGGTSVIGALTKGDVDLLVTLRLEDFDAGVQVLRGHYVINQPENWTPTFASFKDDTSFELPFGAQVAAEGSKTYCFVALRDRLNSDPVALAGYNAIKQAHHAGDATRYREAKGQFIERLLTPELD